jgi:two-component system response regulator
MHSAVAFHHTPLFQNFHAPAETQLKKVSIILADDNPDDQYLMQEAIKAVNPDIEHTAVFNGAQLVDLLMNKGVYASSYQFTPDAIILDLNMPVMDGLQALRIVRDLEKFKTIPVYILYTSRHDDYLNKCSALGVQGIYLKPEEFGALRLIMQHVYHSCGGAGTIAKK